MFQKRAGRQLLMEQCLFCFGIPVGKLTKAYREGTYKELKNGYEIDSNKK